MIRTMLWLDLVTFVFIMAMIYLLLLVLIPRLLFGSRVFMFAVSFFIILTLIYLLVWYLDYRLLRPLDDGKYAVPHVNFSLIAFVQIGAVTTVLLGSVVGLAVFKKWLNDLKRMNDLHALHLRTELAQLKSQVNPHFLFNTFNNLFVLMKTDIEKAGQVLLGLSDLLRYQLYESSAESVLLTKDLDFLHNLLALETIRKNDFEYSIKTEGNIEGIRLPPFLFIAFVENAIKHGASTVGHSYLNIRLNITTGHLFFMAENSKRSTKK
ncbi:MAG: hypothetical protein EOP48_27055 [Sphingobacteriales bacterium]|nr:MAG: hypothetical protein EOP48_27055 [Sphingobacteriales bacterium]